MEDSLFFDTSILVYAYDDADPAKKERCSRYLSSVFQGKSKGYVSSQVLAELFNVLTRHIKYPLDSDMAEAIVNDFIQSDRWTKVNYDWNTLRVAMQSSRNTGVPIWDCLIAETMRESGLFSIVTENEKDFRRISGIKVINPLK